MQAFSFCEAFYALIKQSHFRVDRFTLMRIAGHSIVTVSQHTFIYLIKD